MAPCSPSGSDQPPLQIRRKRTRLFSSPPVTVETDVGQGIPQLDGAVPGPGSTNRHVDVGNVLHSAGDPCGVPAPREDHTVNVWRCEELVAGDANTVCLGATSCRRTGQQTRGWSAVKGQRYAGKGAVNVNMPARYSGVVKRCVNMAQIIYGFGHRGACRRDN